LNNILDVKTKLRLAEHCTAQPQPRPLTSWSETWLTVRYFCSWKRLRQFYLFSCALMLSHYIGTLIPYVTDGRTGI